MIVVATGALALTAAPLAQASKSDRDCDRMPDRWERAHGLSHASTTPPATDRDGLTNLAE